MSCGKLGLPRRERPHLARWKLLHGERKAEVASDPPSPHVPRAPSPAAQPGVLSSSWVPDAWSRWVRSGECWAQSSGCRGGAGDLWPPVQVCPCLSCQGLAEDPWDVSVTALSPGRGNSHLVPHWHATANEGLLSLSCRGKHHVAGCRGLEGLDLCRAVRGTWALTPGRVPSPPMPSVHTWEV